MNVEYWMDEIARMSRKTRLKACLRCATIAVVVVLALYAAVEGLP